MVKFINLLHSALSCCPSLCASYKNAHVDWFLNVILNHNVFTTSERWTPWMHPHFKLRRWGRTHIPSSGWGVCSAVSRSKNNNKMNPFENADNLQRVQRDASRSEGFQAPSGSSDGAREIKTEAQNITAKEYSDFSSSCREHWASARWYHKYHSGILGAAEPLAKLAGSYFASPIRLLPST